MSEKSLSFYIYELTQKKKEIDEINKEVFKLLENNSLNQLKNNERYMELKNKRKDILSQLSDLKKEILNFYLQNPDYNNLYNTPQIKLLLMSN